MGKKPKRLTKKEVSAQAQTTAVKKSVPSPALPSSDVPLSFDSPESSTIVHADYFPEQQTLIVTFIGGRRYGYGNIDMVKWREFEAASSKGEYFNKCIRPMYAGRAL